MFKTRIASTAALFTFGLAALGGTALAVAAPGNADTGASSSTSSSSTSDAPAKITVQWDVKAQIDRDTAKEFAKADQPKPARARG